MSKFAVTIKDRMPSRTQVEHTVTVEAANIGEAREKAREIPDVAWGYKDIMSVEKVQLSSLEEELKEGYIARREEDVKMDKEWEQVTLESWPEY